MLQDFMTIEEIQADQRRIRSEFERARQDLNALSGPGACENPKQMHEAHERFMELQFQGWVRGLQVLEYQETGTLEGSLHRSINKVFVSKGHSPIEWPGK